MQNLPLVSVICISYNHEPYVIESLTSVVNQTYSNIELLIADDFSTDNTVAVIKNWMKENKYTFPFLVHKINQGNTKTFNEALQKANGEFIIDLAADDILLPNCIEEQLKAFKLSKNLGVVYGNIELIDENNAFIANYYTKKDTPECGNIYKMVISLSTKICSVAAMIKKEVFETVGSYDECLAYEDLDFWIRASRRFDFQYIPKILAQKRELKNSLSAHFFKKNNRKTKEIHASTYTILQKAFELNKDKSEHKALLHRIKYEFLRNLYSRNYSYLFKYTYFYTKVILKSI